MILLVSLASSYGKENPEATANYEKTLKQIKAGDLQVDYKALRLNCADSKYSCEADSAISKKVTAFLKDKKFDEALKELNKALDDVFVDIDLHYYAFIANTESGNKDKAEFHKAVIRGLLNSIQENKHGKSAEDAFVVINVHEEYVFLGFSKMQVKQQALNEKDGHSYDVMTCTDMSSDGEKEVTAYFNIDIPMNRMKDALK